MITPKTRDLIKNQALQEKEFSQTYKQGIIWRWHRNEDLYYARKLYGVGSRLGSESPQAGYDNAYFTRESRANVELGKMQSFIHTVLSKIDSPLTFKYNKGSIADLKRARLLNAIKERDANLNDWNIKDLAGKKQAVIYGRAIYAYYADSHRGYRTHLEPVDVYDFLIDPNGGGLDIDLALYCGRYGITLNKEQLKQGVKDKLYYKDEVTNLIDGAGNNNEITKEEQNKQNRYSYIGSPAQRTMQNTNVFKFWEWYTTYEGKRYYLLMTDAGQCIRCELLTDIFKEDPELGDANYPFWTWAAFLDLTEFWTPSFADYVREIFMAQSVTINQMLDNAEQIVKPQRMIDESKVVNRAELIYKRNGLIRFKPDTDINKAFRMVEVNQIDTPLKVYETLEAIQQLESGVNAASKGVAEEEKVGIYEGNQAQTADRFGLLNKSYSYGYKRFAKLYKNGVEQHLTKKIAVKILGPDGLEKTIFVGKRDVKPSAEYDVTIESSNAEAQADAVDKKNKLTFLSMYNNNPLVNQKELFEIQASTVGFNHDEIRKLLDTSEFGSAEVLSEAERDIEDILDGKIIQVNDNANTAYAQHILNYMKDHKEDMDDDTFILFTDYMERIQDTVVRNSVRSLGNAVSKEGLSLSGGEGMQTEGEVESLQPEVMGETQAQLTNNEPAQPNVGI